jgi:hypothetical protein
VGNQECNDLCKVKVIVRVMVKAPVVCHHVALCQAIHPDVQCRVKWVQGVLVAKVRVRALIVQTLVLDRSNVLERLSLRLMVSRLALWVRVELLLVMRTGMRMVLIKRALVERIQVVAKLHVNHRKMMLELLHVSPLVVVKDVVRVMLLKPHANVLKKLLNRQNLKRFKSQKPLLFAT